MCLLGCSGWLPRKLLWISVWLLGCSGWLFGCCYVVARVFSVVTYQPKANTEMNEWKKKNIYISN